jgi:hypothetical protein
MNDEAIGRMFAELERAEARMVRAFNRWVKCKAKVKRFDKRYAKELEKALPKVELPKPGPKPWPNDMGVKVRKVKLKKR